MASEQSNGSIPTTLTCMQGVCREMVEKTEKCLLKGSSNVTFPAATEETSERPIETSGHLGLACLLHQA
jgi:hypothetical protein